MASNTPAQLAAKMKTFSGSGLQRAQRSGVEAAAREIKMVALPFMQAAAGGNLRLSGVGGKKMRAGGGAKVGVRYDMKGTVNPTAIVYAVGPAHLLERGAKPHHIPKARGVGSRKKLSSGAVVSKRSSRARLLVINGRVITGPVIHPGAPGKFPWAQALKVSAPRAPRVFQKYLWIELRRAFRG